MRHRSDSQPLGLTFGTGMRWLLNGEGGEPTALQLLPEGNARAHVTTPGAERCRRAAARSVCVAHIVVVAHTRAQALRSVARYTVLLSHHITGDLLLCAGSGAAAQKVES